MGATILFYLCFRNRDPRIRDANIYGRCTRTRATRPRGAGGGRYGKVPREIGWPVSTRRGELDSGRTVSANPFLVALGRLRTG